MAEKKGMEEYWTSQSDGYSQVNIEELETEHVRETWEKLLCDNLPKGKKLRVLEAGCGPGFLSILLSNMGHIVTATDFSDSMLEQAWRNAEKYCNSTIEFRKMDAQNLELENESFDVVVSRNVTWTLADPESAYREWLRVLKPGGRILNIDGNWWLHRYYSYMDELRKAAEAEAMTAGYQLIPDDYENEHQGLEKEERLPLEDKLRPYWDLNYLNSLGGNTSTAMFELPEGVMSEYYSIIYRYSPQFMIKVDKK